MSGALGGLTEDQIRQLVDEEIDFHKLNGSQAFELRGIAGFICMLLRFGAQLGGDHSVVKSAEWLLNNGLLPRVDSDVRKAIFDWQVHLGQKLDESSEKPQ